MPLTVKRLREILENEHIPDDAFIIVEADHGQDPEFAYEIVTTKSIGDYPDEFIWEHRNYESIYDHDALEEYESLTKITAICLCGE